jgi:hypothetical protein
MRLPRPREVVARHSRDYPPGLACDNTGRRRAVGGVGHCRRRTTKRVVLTHEADEGSFGSWCVAAALQVRRGERGRLAHAAARSENFRHGRIDACARRHTPDLDARVVAGTVGVARQ